MATTFRTDALDLKRGDVIVYRTHKSTTRFQVVKVEAEDTFGNVRLHLRTESPDGFKAGPVKVFKTSGVSRFEVV